MIAAITEGARPPVPDFGFYSQLAQLERAVCSGTHATIKIPEAAIGAYQRSVSGLRAFPSSPPEVTKQTIPSFLALSSQRPLDGVYPTPAKPITAAVSKHVKDTRPISNHTQELLPQGLDTNDQQPPLYQQTRPSIDPVLLTKSDDLVHAEIRLKRQRIERGLKNSAYAQKAAWQDRNHDVEKDAAISAGVNRLDVADIYMQSLAAVQHISGLGPLEKSDVVAEQAPSDDNSYYSSQGNSWASKSRHDGDVDGVVRPSGRAAFKVLPVRNDQPTPSAKSHHAGALLPENSHHCDAVIYPRSQPVHQHADALVPMAHPLPPRPITSQAPPNDSRDNSYSPPIPIEVHNSFPAPDVVMGDNARDGSRSPVEAHILPRRHPPPSRESDSYSPPSVSASPEGLDAPQRRGQTMQSADVVTIDLDGANDVFKSQGFKSKRARYVAKRAEKQRNEKAVQRQHQIHPKRSRLDGRHPNAAAATRRDDNYVPLASPRKRLRTPDMEKDDLQFTGKRRAYDREDAYIKSESMSPVDLTNVLESDYPRRLVLQSDGSPQIQIYSPWDRPAISEADITDESRHIPQRRSTIATAASTSRARLGQARSVSTAMNQPSQAVPRPSPRHTTQLHDSTARPHYGPAQQDLRRIASLQHASKGRLDLPYPDAENDTASYGGPTSSYVAQILDYHRPPNQDVPFARLVQPNTHYRPDVHISENDHNVVFEEERHMVPVAPMPPAVQRMIDENGVEWVPSQYAIASQYSNHTASYIPLPSLPSGRSAQPRPARTTPYLQNSAAIDYTTWPRIHTRPPVQEGIYYSARPLGARHPSLAYDSDFDDSRESRQDAIIGRLERQMQMMSEEIRSLRAASQAPSYMASGIPSQSAAPQWQ